MSRRSVVVAAVVSVSFAALLLVPAGSLGSSSEQRARAQVPAPPIDVCGMLVEVLGPDATYDAPVLDADPDLNDAIEVRYPSRDVMVCDTTDIEIPTPEGVIVLDTFRVGVATMGSEEDAVGRVAAQTAQLSGMELRDIADERVRVSGFVIGAPDSWQDLQYRVVDEYSLSNLFTYRDSAQPEGHEQVTEVVTEMIDAADLDPADWIA